MGAGRKTQTFLTPASAGPSGGGTGPAPQRGLSKGELGGVIFGCTNSTIAECMNHNLFGLPQHHIKYVQHIRPGMCLFLFNYTGRMLHGIYEAVGEGALNIEPSAWTDGRSRTQFPAQVKFRIKQTCSPLPEATFKEAISENYYSEIKFTFELTSSQKDHLVHLFTKNMEGPTKSLASKGAVQSFKIGGPAKVWKEAKYNNLTARNFTNGDTTPSPPAIAREKLSLFDIVAPVSDDLLTLNNNLQTVVGSENAMLMAAARQIFGAGGKRMRPAVVFLVSRATSDLYVHQDIRPQHRRLAEITEMIHTASLIHDDVLDESDTRRGKQTVHQTFGTRVAVLAGDFMFAQSSWYLANLDNLEVIKLISQVIRDFANGEIKQAQSLFNCDVTLQDYMDKSYYKTASLIAASTRSAAIFSGSSPKVCDQMFQYGMQLGLAFQIVDDILDFTQTSEQLGKPAGSDLAKGNLTAPVLFALTTEPQLRELIDTEFTEEGSLEFAISLVHQGGGIEKAQELAKQKGELALKSLDCLPQGACRQSLEKMVDYVLERIS